MNYEELKIEMAKYQPTMTNGERTMAYAKGEEVDHQPFSAYGGETMAPLYGYSMEEYRHSFEVQADVMEQMVRDLAASPAVTIGLGLKGVGEAMGSELVYPEYGIDYVKEHVLTDYAMLPELEAKFDPATNPFLQEKLELMRKFRAKYDKNAIIITSIAGPMSTAASIRKTELLMKDMIRNKEGVHALMAACVRCTLKWVKAVVDEFGPVGISFSDPVSSPTIINEARFVEFCKEPLRDLHHGVMEINGSNMSIHICGRSKELWPHIMDIGFSAFSVDNIEDLAELKKTVGHKLSISGNVPPVAVLKEGTIDDVIEAVKKCLLAGADSPMGYTVTPGCQVPIDTPMENLQAYIYAIRRYGRGAKKGHFPRGLYEEGLL